MFDNSSLLNYYENRTYVLIINLKGDNSNDRKRKGTN